MKSHLDKAKAKLRDRYGDLSNVDYNKAMKVVGSTAAARLTARGMLKRASGEKKKGKLGKAEQIDEIRLDKLRKYAEKLASKPLFAKTLMKLTRGSANISDTLLKSPLLMTVVGRFIPPIAAADRDWETCGGAGTTNTGGGGGGAFASSPPGTNGIGGAGGSGIVVARAPLTAGVIFSVNNPGGQQPGSTPNYNEVSQAPNGDIVAKFIASGTLNILDTACGVNANYLIVAGGGGGGNVGSLRGPTSAGGGGGAGGYRTSCGCGS